MGIVLEYYSYADIINNLFSNINNYAISVVYESYATIFDNTISSCLGGITLGYGNLSMKYNHITNCTEFEVSSDYGVAPDTIMNNNIWCPESVNYLNCPDSSLGILVTVNDNGDSCDIYGNISMDPFFESGTPYSYYLQSSSPCIDAGMDLGFPYYGNAPDIGALESNFMGVDDFTDNIPTKFFLGDNYPNPFNQTTTIKFDLARTAKVNLSITNILGEEVRELCSDFLSPGSYVFQWDSQNASSGIYFIIFNADNYKKIVKCVCIK